MTLEIVAAALVGLAAVWGILQPLFGGTRPRTAVYEPPDPEDTPKGVALAALKEIEFDRETGKLSDDDYAFLKTRYTAEALTAMRAEEAEESGSDIERMIDARRHLLTADGAPATACTACGPRPEPDALFCSSCGRRVESGHHCARCDAVIPPGGRFCERCGSAVAA